MANWPGYMTEYAERVRELDPAEFSFAPVPAGVQIVDPPAAPERLSFPLGPLRAGLPAAWGRLAGHRSANRPNLGVGPKELPLGFEPRTSSLPRTRSTS